MFRLFRASLRYRWWRIRTALRLLSPRVRQEWFRVFHGHPDLHAARHFIWNRETGSLHAHLGFQTMAGYYNDHVAGGNMTEEQARRVYARG